MGEEELASLQSELQSARERAGQLESELSAASESVGKADAPERGAEADAAERANADADESGAKANTSEPGASEPEPEPAPEPKREGRTELTPEEVLGRKEPVASPEAAKETEPSAAATATQISNPSAEPSRPEPDRVALAEPQRADSVYAVPDPTAPVVRSTSQSGTRGVAVLQVVGTRASGVDDGSAAHPVLARLAGDADPRRVHADPRGRG